MTRNHQSPLRIGDHVHVEAEVVWVGTHAFAGQIEVRLIGATDPLFGQDAPVLSVDVKNVHRKIVPLGEPE